MLPIVARYSRYLFAAFALGLSRVQRTMIRLDHPPLPSRQLRQFESEFEII